MRCPYRTLCAAALVACADAKGPTLPVARKSAAALPRPGQPDAPERTTVDPRPVPDRLQDLIGAGIAKVDIPPDGFSLTSDAVHPDIACPPAGWGEEDAASAHCWLMYTPYKNSDATYENPAFLEAKNDTAWVTPSGVKNPIVPWPGFNQYNSDPDHAFDPRTRRLVQIYRVVADGYNKIMVMSTADAKQWTKPVVAFQEKNHDAVSPSLIIEPDRTAKVWYVRAGVDGCTSASSSVELRAASLDSTERFEQAKWSAPVHAYLAIRNSVVWHLDVAETPNGYGYLAFVVAYPKGLTCSNSDLWLASSFDGIHWRTYPIPILWRGMAAAKRRSIYTWYRGTLRYDPETDSLHLWPSALAGATWTVYHTGAKLSEILGLLHAARPADLLRLSLERTTGHVTIKMP